MPPENFSREPTRPKNEQRPLLQALRDMVVGVTSSVAKTAVKTVKSPYEGAVGIRGFLKIAWRLRGGFVNELLRNPDDLLHHVIPLLGEFTNIKTVINSIPDRYIKTEQRKALELLLTALCKDKGSALERYVRMVIKQLNDDKALPVTALKHQLIASRPDLALTINAVEEGSNTVEFLLNAMGIAKDDKLQEKDQFKERADSGMNVFSEGDSVAVSPISVMGMSALPAAP